MSWNHDRVHVRFLHHAHADHIESLYTAMMARAGDPDGVVIAQVGPVRTLLATGDRWENRAIFHGDETTDQIDDVLQHFARHRAHCVIEVNIANSYVDPPGNWGARLLPHLLARGCKVGGMRCVWCFDPSAAVDRRKTDCRIERFEPGQISAFAELVQKIDPNEQWPPTRGALESRPGVIQYAGFIGANPCGFGSMFVKGQTAYLSYWQTAPAYRNRGAQQAAIHQRVADAMKQGCASIFSVSDFNSSSANNFQRCGFRLAYNYLVVKREPMPL